MSLPLSQTLFFLLLDFPCHLSPSPALVLRNLQHVQRPSAQQKLQGKPPPPPHPLSFIDKYREPEVYTEMETHFSTYWCAFFFFS